MTKDLGVWTAEDSALLLDYQREMFEVIRSEVVPRRGLGPYRVAPIGYGAMRLTGRGVFGPPPDRDDAVQLLREAVGAGVDDIDTADYYGTRVVNELIRQALHPSTSW